MESDSYYLVVPRPSTFTLFPYTTLFRSGRSRTRFAERPLQGRYPCEPVDPGLRPGLTETALQAENTRSEEHTSELQSRLHLVCRLLLAKKNYRRILFNVRTPILCTRLSS